MNVIAKQAAVARLRKAIEIEKLSTKDTASFLGLNPTYISMFLNERHWIKCPAYAFERLCDWCNHGTTLRTYVIPQGASVWKCKEPVKTDQEPIIKAKPEALAKRKKELAEKEKTEVTPVPEFKEATTTTHIELKPGEEVEFRKTIKDDHLNSPDSPARNRAFLLS